MPPRTDSEDELHNRWRLFCRTVSRLEALLQKQLRRRPWTEEEAKFIKELGPVLAGAMGYSGNVYNPEDDAPGCVQLVRYADRDVSLTAAIGRPRIYYLLYPWDGREIFCEGSAIPYYEFETPRRLTDQEWRKQLDSPECPPCPEWERGIASESATPAAR